MREADRLLIRGGRLVDPSQMVDGVSDILIEDGRVSRVSKSIAPEPGWDVVDATGQVVAPGLIDAHVHLRDPGFEYKETLESGARAAAAGGFTAICCMPNTSPALDTGEAVHDIVERSRSLPVRVYPIGTISTGREGAQLADLRGMAGAGAIGFSDDGDSTKSSAVMRQALEESARLNLPIMVHCEDWTLIQGGAMHEGEVSEELGVPGLPAAAEEIIIARDIELARLTGGWLYVLHVSTRRGRDLVRAAKRDGVRITGEVMPHHLRLTDEWVAGRRRYAGEEHVEAGRNPDPNAKVNPPLRTADDAEALLEGVLDGTFDIIATDHAPHAAREKRELGSGAFGMIGLEVALPLLLDLTRTGKLPWSTLVERMSIAPARILGLPGGTLAPGSPANVTVIDPDTEWVVSEETIVSKSKNTPLLGMSVCGRAAMTVVDGKVVHRV